MPVIEFDQADVDYPNRLAIDVVLSPMIWPADPEAQARYVKAAHARACVDLARGAPPHPVTGERNAPADAVALVYESRHLLVEFESDDYRKEFEKQKTGGILAGATLCDQLGAVELELQDGGIASRLENVIERLGVPAASARTAERMWREFKPVAHLWAAHLLLCDRAFDDGEPPPAPPCRVEQFPEFIAYAEALADRAEATKATPTSPATILTPGETYRAANGLALPGGELGWELK